MCDQPCLLLEARPLLSLEMYFVSEIAYISLNIVYSWSAVLSHYWCVYILGL